MNDPKDYEETPPKPVTRDDYPWNQDWARDAAIDNGIIKEWEE